MTLNLPAQVLCVSCPRPGIPAAFTKWESASLLVLGCLFPTVHRDQHSLL
jgi:hypothetical protein